MITKLNLSPLDNFKSIRPSQGGVPTGYTLSISPQRIHMNTNCYHHFKGHEYFRFMLHSHYLAVVATSKDDPNAIRMPARHSKDHGKYSYNPLFNKGIHKRIVRRLWDKPINKTVRIRITKVDKEHVSPKYLIFDLENRN